MTRVLAIDPGANGGIAWVDEDGIIRAKKMPEGMTAQVDLFATLRNAYNLRKAVVEKVGFHREGNSASSSATFARHCGHIEAALYVLGFSTEEVAPGVWMRSLGALPTDKKARKTAIRSRMQRKHPHLKVTLATADALGILTWAIGRGK